MADVAAQAAQDQQAAQQANGRAPLPQAGPAPDTGEKWLGVLVIAAGCFLLLVGFDRVTGGRLIAGLTGEDDSATG